MNFKFAIFSLLTIFNVVPVECQRLQPFEMLQIINDKDNTEIANSEETKKCLPVIKGDYHPEIHYEYSICDSSPHLLFKLIMKVYNVSSNCTGYQCWESVLTDASKLAILDIFNSFRQKVARGTCGPLCKTNNNRLIFRLIWEYPSEMEAAYWLQMCGLEPRPMNEPFNGEIISRDLHENHMGEFIHVSFKVQTGVQSELLSNLKKFLQGNYLYDWDEKYDSKFTFSHQFRRGTANTIGCAYLVRYNVTMKTDLNEDVRNGNVAVFGCFISSYFGKNRNFPFNYYSPKIRASNSTPENCAKITTDSIMQPVALYPSLCMSRIDVKHAATPTMICQPDIGYSGQMYHEVCKPYNSTKNPETWNERTYGYVIRWSKVPKGNTFIRVPAPECNIPEFPDVPKPKPVNVDTNKLDFNCTLKHEVNSNTASKLCSESNCDDSQLTDETRQYVLNSLNEARHHVAQGNCLKQALRPPCERKNVKYCNLVKLRWHWYLESKAAERVQNCPTEYGSRQIHYDNSPFEEPVFYEEVSLIFELPVDGQIKLPGKIPEIFWSNGFNDWNADGTFRRGNAAFIGCAIVIRPGQRVDSTRQEYKMENGSVTHMVCIFASLDQDFISAEGSPDDFCCPTCTEKDCRFKTVKKQQPFPFLCTSIFYNITMSCAIDNCSLPHHRSLAWKYFVEGETVLEHRNDTIEHIHRPSPESYYDYYMGHVYRKKNCRILILLFLVTLSVFCLVLALFYKHSVEKKYYSM